VNTGPDANDDTDKASLYWHYYSDAARRNDQAAASKYLDQLLVQNPVSLDIVPSLVVALRDRGMNQQARTCSLAPTTITIASSPLTRDSAHAMNAVAWLCAECNEHNDQALKLAESAVQADPLNGGILDTLAEFTGA